MVALAEAKVPDHVPEHLVYDFHIFGDEGYIADPYGRAREMLREAPPVFWSPRGNCWYVVGYDALVEGFKDVERFSNMLFAERDPDYPYMPYPLALDPPRHAAYAAPLKAAFSPVAMLKLDGRIRAQAIELIEAFVRDGHCDYMTALAEPFPILIFFSIMGFPRERFAEFRQLAIDYLNETDMRLRGAHQVRVDELMSELIEERRKQPQDDLISRLWSLEIEGKPITTLDMRRYGFMLFSAGLDSVTNGLGHAMHQLARNPQVQAWMRENPQEINAATEELLRNGVTTPPRRVAKDNEFYGAPMKAGDMVEMFVIGGNLNESVFADPTEFRIKRDRTHLTFGHGIHRCIGAHLARIEMHILYQEWFSRMPEVRLDPDRRVAFDPGHILRIANLPLVWDPSKAPSKA
jgi:cytochrome P450